PPQSRAASHRRSGLAPSGRSNEKVGSHHEKCREDTLETTSGIAAYFRTLRCHGVRVSATAQENVMFPLRPDRPLPAPIWICPICQKLMRTGTIEIADGKEQTKLACATCGTQATQSEFAD